jgi:hypothetical protein
MRFLEWLIWDGGSSSFCILSLSHLDSFIFLIYVYVHFTLISEKNTGQEVDIEFLLIVETYKFKRVFDIFLFLKSSFTKLF